MSGLSDSFDRPINYLRISVTDRCNLRCIYCMPAGGLSLMPREQILSYEEILQVARAAASLGITKVRLTGGEPLVRSGLVEMVRMLAGVPGIDDLSLTTNGVLLARQSRELRAAGLRRVNVSLDSLQPERFGRITRVGRQEEVLAGINAARETGLDPVKINVVLMRGINDDEVLDLARLSRGGEWHIRFIELMPFTRGGHRNRRFLPASEAKQQIESLGELEPCTGGGGGPARYFRFPSAPGTIGFITPVSDHFCFGCNRLRLTADGRLRLCLLRDEEVDLRGPLRQGASPEELKSLIAKAVAAKPRMHELAGRGIGNKRPMIQIGG